MAWSSMSLGVDHIFMSTRRIISRTWRRRPRWSASPGIQTGGSERAFDLFMKARYLDEHTPATA